MKIFNPDGTDFLAEVIITANARHEQELMKSDFIALEWNDDTYRSIPSGAYILHNDVRYTLYDKYEPENQNGVYKYKPVFQAPAMILAHTPCLFLTQNVSHDPIYQTDWVYTGNIQTIIGRIVRIIEDQIGTHLEPIIQIKSTTSLPASATCTFSGVDIISALNEVCTQFGGLDWHIEWDGVVNHGGTLYVGDITAGGVEYEINQQGELVPTGDTPSPIQLAEGGNVQFASVNKNGEAFANYFIVRGGTRNITIQTQSEDKVQTDTRLELNPNTYPGSVIDRREDKAHEPKIQKVLIFDDVYPKLDLYAYNIRKRTRYLIDSETKNPIPASYDSNGKINAYKKYSVYYMQLAYPTNAAKTTWSPKRINKATDIMAGQKPMCSFEPNEKGTHSALAGREFELIYHETAQSYTGKTRTADDIKQATESMELVGDVEDSGVEILLGDFEIVFEQDDDFIIPNDNTLEPWGEQNAPTEQCDIVVLFNVVMSDDYITKAQADLYTAADNEISRILTDDNNYTVKSNPIAFNTSNPNLKIGSSVDFTLQNGTIMNTRVIKLVTNIDYPCQQEITIGNAIIKGSTQSLKEDVKSLSAAIDINESSATTINKMISQLYRALREFDNTFLHKDRDDATQFTLGAGILNVLHQAVIGGTTKSDICNEGGMSDGTGWYIRPEGNAQFESIEVRSALRVLELVYNRLSAEESEYVFTEGGTIKTVTQDGQSQGGLNQYIIEMDKRNETDFHAFREGDVLRGVVNNLQNLGSGEYYTVWLHVESTDTLDGHNSMVVTQYADNDCPSGHNYPPAELMVVQRWGNSVAPTAENHTDARYRAFIDEVNGEYVNRRQSCWYISSTEKRICMLDHVNHPKISEGNYAAFFGLPTNLSTFKGHYMNPLQPYLYVRGAFLQDIYYIDYLGNIIKQERFRGVWNEYTASSSDPYCVTETTFDTVYYDQAKWKCVATQAMNPPSKTNAEWELLQEAVDATFYRLVPSQTSIKRDDEGYPYVTHLNVRVEKIEGKDATIIPDANVLMILNNTEIREASSIELAKDDGIENVEFILLPEDGAKFGEAVFGSSTFAVPLASVSVPIISDGKPGESGSGIESLTEQYAVSDSANTQPSSSDWTTLANAQGLWDAEMPYLWNRETTTYSGGKSPDVRVHIIAIYTEDGRGIRSVTNYYKASNLSTGESASSGTWYTDPAQAVISSSLRYLWNYEVITFTDNTTQATDPAVVGVYSVGGKGDRGAILRGPTEWKENVQYLGGNSGEQYQDIVARTVDGVTTFYLCHYTHVSSNQHDPHSDNKPVAPWGGDNEYWQRSQVGDFVATKVLFTERALIENVNITGTITSETLRLDSSSPQTYVANNGRSITLSPMLFRMVVLPLLNNFLDEGTEWSLNGYNVSGTHIQIHTEPQQDVCNWAASDLSGWINENEYLFKLLKYSTLVCADPNCLIDGSQGNYPKHLYGGSPYWSNDYMHGRFSARGMISRFVLLPPGQSLSLTSSIQTVDNTQCLVWEIENAADFTPINVKLMRRNNGEIYSTVVHNFEGTNTAIHMDANSWQENFLSYKGLDFNVYNADVTDSPDGTRRENSLQILIHHASGGGTGGLEPLELPTWRIGIKSGTKFANISDPDKLIINY